MPEISSKRISTSSLTARGDIAQHCTFNPHYRRVKHWGAKQVVEVNSLFVPDVSRRNDLSRVPVRLVHNRSYLQSWASVTLNDHTVGTGMGNNWIGKGRRDIEDALSFFQGLTTLFW